MVISCGPRRLRAPPHQHHRPRSSQLTARNPVHTRSLRGTRGRFSRHWHRDCVPGGRAGGLWARRQQAPNDTPNIEDRHAVGAPERHLRSRPTARRVSPRPSAVDAELQRPVCGSDVKVANLLPHFDRTALGPSSRGSGARSASANSCAAGLRGTCCKPFRINAANKPGGEITDGASRSDESGRAHGGLAPPTSQTMIRATSARTCCQRNVHRQGHQQLRDDLLARPEGARGVR
jgi:hypothetical protein